VAWIYVIIAGLLEIAWAVGLKASERFTRPGITALTLTGAILSFFYLALGMRSQPIPPTGPTYRLPDQSFVRQCMHDKGYEFVRK
jgi:multidrug transporter EmrE-like cation transporter